MIHFEDVLTELNLTRVHFRIVHYSVYAVILRIHKSHTVAFGLRPPRKLKLWRATLCRVEGNRRVSETGGKWKNNGGKVKFGGVLYLLGTCFIHFCWQTEQSWELERAQGRGTHFRQGHFLTLNSASGLGHYPRSNPSDSAAWSAAQRFNLWRSTWIKSSGISFNDTAPKSHSHCLIGLYCLYSERHPLFLSSSVRGPHWKMLWTGGKKKMKEEVHLLGWTDMQ